MMIIIIITIMVMIMILIITIINQLMSNDEYFLVGELKSVHVTTFTL